MSPQLRLKDYWLPNHGNCFTCYFSFHLQRIILIPKTQNQDLNVQKLLFNIKLTNDFGNAPNNKIKISQIGTFILQIPFICIIRLNLLIFKLRRRISIL